MCSQEQWFNIGNVYNIDFSQKIIESYFIDDNGSYVENKDGVFKFVVKINEKRQITESFQKDKNDNLIESEDAGAIQLWNFDEQNRFLWLNHRIVLLLFRGTW